MQQVKIFTGDSPLSIEESINNFLNDSEIFVKNIFINQVGFAGLHNSIYKTTYTILYEINSTKLIKCEDRK